MAQKGVSVVTGIDCLPRTVLHHIACLLEDSAANGSSEGLTSFIAVCKEWCEVGRGATKLLSIRSKTAEDWLELSTTLRLFRNPDRKLVVRFCRGLSIEEVAEAVKSRRVKHLEFVFPANFSRRLQQLPVTLGHWEGLESLVFRGETHRPPFDVQTFPAEVVSNWGNLRVLSLCSSRVGALPSAVRCWSRLEELSLNSWLIVTLPKGVSAWQRLRKISLRECLKIKGLPEEVRNWGELEEVDFTGCNFLLTLPEGVAAWSKLRRISFRQCSKLKSLPSGVQNWELLEEASFKYCWRLLALPSAAVGEWRNLTSLNLFRVPLPDGASNWRKLRKVKIHSYLLGTLPDWVGEWTRLKHAKLHRLTALPQAVAGWESLTVLQLSCSALKTLPDGVGGWTQLREADLSSCQTLVTLPQSVEEWGSLEVLKMCAPENAQLLNSGVRGWTSLKSLSIGEDSLLWHDGNPIPINLFDGKSPSMLPRIELPLEVGAWARLEILELGRVVAFPEAVSGWTALRSLYVHEYESEALPEGVGLWRKLTSLSMTSTRLLGFPDTVGAWELLEVLNLCGCARLKTLPDTVSGWRSLKVARMSGCVELTALPEGVAGWENVQELDLGEIRDSICSHHVYELSLDGCFALTSLPQGVGAWKAVRRINLGGCKVLRELPLGVGNWKQVKHVELAGCEHLHGLPPSAEQWPLLLHNFYLGLEGCRSDVCHSSCLKDYHSKREDADKSVVNKPVNETARKDDITEGFR
jgi:hypothetical protein